MSPESQNAASATPHSGCNFHQPLDQLFCIEVFAGSGRLTASLKAIGLKDSFGVDSTIPSHLKSPILQLNLLKADHLTMLQDMIASPNCVYIHFAPPCGTASRARLIQRKGRKNPPIVRTDEFPDGIPNLDGVLLDRVLSANALYAITCDLVRLCEQLGKLWSVENPGRSFMWVTSPFKALLQEIQYEAVQFHHCRYGSSRRKLTMFVHNIKHFQTLELFCQNDHEHESWGQTSTGSWATAEEVAYPWDLCRAMATKIALELQTRGAHCTAPCFALQEHSLQSLRAATDIQPRRGLPPMVSEFLEVQQLPAHQPLPPLARKLSTPHPGVNNASAINQNDATVTIGIHRSPQEFVEEALKVGHPSLVQSIFPLEMLNVVKHCVSVTPETLAKERAAELRRWTSLVSDLADAEKQLLASLSERRRDILQGKKLLLLERLMKDSGHPDVDLTRNLADGFDLTGALPEANIFKKKFRPAVISCPELRKMADIGRRALINSVSSSGDPELDRGLLDATMKEVTKGYLIGPISESQLPPGATLTRRFAVRQKNKIRPIDDYRASMLMLQSPRPKA